MLVKLRPISSKAQAMCNSGQLLGLDGHTIVLSAKGSKFVMDSLNDQRLRGVIEPAIEEVFGQKLGLRCELSGDARQMLGTAPAAAVALPRDVGAGAEAPPVAASEEPATAEPVAADTGRPAAPRGRRGAVPPPRDLVNEAKNNPTVRMAMDAFGARIEHVIPIEDDRAAG
jgi:hypothetical protein